jgi:hypothetical protein
VAEFTTSEGALADTFTVAAMGGKLAPAAKDV